MDPNPNAFPLRDTEFHRIGDTSNPQYAPLDIRRFPALHDPAAEEFHTLAAHKINITAELARSDRVFFVCDRPLAVEDPLRPGPNEPDTKETFVWFNHLGKELRRLPILFHLKREACRALESVVRWWALRFPHAQFKIGLEVKAIFKKVLHGQQNNTRDDTEK